MAKLWEGDISSRTIGACVASYWVHAKKKTYGYIERDQAKRQAFIEQLATVPGSQRVYIDEAGIDNRDEYGYGWNQGGQRFYAAVFCGGIIPPQTNLLKTGRRAGRVNLIAAWCAGQLLAPFTIEGACNRVVFETWVENCVSPVVQLLSSSNFR